MNSGLGVLLSTGVIARLGQVGGQRMTLQDVDPFDIEAALSDAAGSNLSPGARPLVIDAPFDPAGDQQSAIDELVAQLEAGQERGILLGVTGSGKTYTMAQIIQRLNIPTLVLSHNKTLARQVWQEMSELFPTNAVEYFVSYYDYYQPEAYLPGRDLFIDKELSRNERIEQERFSCVASLVTRPDCVVVASVSSIYGLNPPETFRAQHARVHVGMSVDPQELVRQLVTLQYQRTTSDLQRGNVRVRGEVVDVWMPSRDMPLRIRFGFDGVEQVQLCDAVSWEVIESLEEAWIHPKEFFMTLPERFDAALVGIEKELDARVRWFQDQGKTLEAHRLEQRTQFDLEMLRELGHCSGVENYSRWFDGRDEGERPYCLFDFMAACAKRFHGSPDRYLVFMDESHVTLPQVQGMHHGDRARKLNLIDHGFRLPSAYDNRPLRLDEFQRLVPQLVYVSATPGERELRHLAEVTGQAVPQGLLHVASGGGVTRSEVEKPKERTSMVATLAELDGVVRMEVRPTGLLDPNIEVRGTEGQVQDLLSEIERCVERDERVLVTVLTIKFAEEVAEYLGRMGVKAHYLHSEIDTIERSEIIKALRLGHVDVIVGINLLREGLDLPEVGLVAIFDANREGFLRNERSLLQTIGRAARNVNGRVIMYADSMSPAMEAAIDATLDRRVKQQAHNEAHGIVPRTVSKAAPTMGVDADELAAGTAGRAAGGGKRLVGKRDRRADVRSRFDLGAGRTSQREHPEESRTSVADDLTGPVPVDEGDRARLRKKLEQGMREAAKELDFERAAALRDRLFELDQAQLEP